MDFTKTKYTTKIFCSYSKVNLGDSYLKVEKKKVIPNCFVPTATMRKRVQFKSPYFVLEEDCGRTCTILTPYVEEKPSVDEL